MTSRAEDGGRSELEMSPEQMMASALRAAELVSNVSRIYLTNLHGVVALGLSSR